MFIKNIRLRKQALFFSAALISCFEGFWALLSSCTSQSLKPCALRVPSFLVIVSKLRQKYTAKRFRRLLLRDCAIRAAVSLGFIPRSSRKSCHTWVASCSPEAVQTVAVKPCLRENRSMPTPKITKKQKAITLPQMVLRFLHFDFLIGRIYRLRSGNFLVCS